MTSLLKYFDLHGVHWAMVKVSGLLVPHVWVAWLSECCILAPLNKITCTINAIWYIEQLHTWWVHWVQILGLCQGHVWASSGVLETPKILEQSEITLWIYKFMTQQLILWCLYGWSKSGLTTDISLPMLHIKVPIYSLRKLDNINSVNISGHLLWLAAD